MNNIEKWELVRTKLLANPGLSDRDIATSCIVPSTGRHVSPTLVGRVRRYLEERKELSVVGKRRGKDGKERRTAEEIVRQTAAEKQAAEAARIAYRAQMEEHLAKLQNDWQEADEVDKAQLEFFIRNVKNILNIT